MKVCLVATLCFVLVSSSLAQRPYTEHQVIAYAKSIDVQTLDPSLPSQRLEDWLQFGPPHSHIWSWVVADTCDLKPDDPNTDYPLCVKVTFGRDGENARFLTQVGTSRSGIAGRPQLYYGIGVWEGLLINTGGTDRLSEVPGLLDQPVVADGVQKLYEQIVRHHPIGIPMGTNMEAVRSFLSKRLAEQIETAHACEDDYRHQSPTRTAASKPAWLESGLFSGEGSHAAPVDAVAVRKEKQNDNSFFVYVELEPAEAIINRRHGPRAFHGGYTWEVVARVISENGKFVVDDVRIYDGFPAKGPSHLVSDSFGGCDGTHWVGITATRGGRPND